jgi:hypothetical protein
MMMDARPLISHLDIAVAGDSERRWEGRLTGPGWFVVINITQAMLTPQSTCV